MEQKVGDAHMLCSRYEQRRNYQMDNLEMPVDLFRGFRAYAGAVYGEKFTGKK